MLVSAGFSVNCVEIYYGKHDYVCISPENKDKFIETLRERCPQARFESEDPHRK